MAAQIKGMDKVLRNLNKEIKKIKKKSMTGLVKSAILIRRDMDKTSPLIPIDTGNLRASFFVVTNRGSIKRGASPDFKGDDAAEMASQHSSIIAMAPSRINTIKGPAVTLGFTANYAWYVHEMVGANFDGPTHRVKLTKKGNVTAKTKKYLRRSGAETKFFEASLNRNKHKILEVIRKEAKIR